MYIPIVLLFFLYQFKVDGQFIPKSRGWAGCSLVNTTIHCFGGLTALYVTDFVYGQVYNLTNEHLAIDLSQYKNDFSDFNKSNVEWKLLSNTVNATNKTSLQGIAEIASVPIYSDNSFLIYGGEQDGSGGNATINYPFVNYDTQADIWIPKNLSKNDYFTSHTTLVNLGNDTIWIWGGYSYATLKLAPNKLKLYNYKTSAWTIGSTMNWKSRLDHTATLTNDGLIYVLGGLTSYLYENYTYGNETYKNIELVDYIDMRNITTFNTHTFEWANITAVGDEATYRMAHTTTYLPDKELFIIYGGFVFATSGNYPVPDPFYIYDLKNNSYKRVTFPALDTTNLRYAHFATLYGNNSLVLALGFIKDQNVGGDSLSVLNITDPYQPNWLGIPSSTPSSSPSPSSAPIDGLNQQSKIAIIVVVVVVVVIGAIAIFFFIRSRKRRQKKAFSLEYDSGTASSESVTKEPCKLYGMDNNEVKYTKVYDVSPDENLCKPHGSK